MIHWFGPQGSSKEARIPHLGFSFGRPRNSVDKEFRVFFVLPSLPNSVRNCLKFRKIPQNSVIFSYKISYDTSRCSKGLCSVDTSRFSSGLYGVDNTRHVQTSTDSCCLDASKCSSSPYYACPSRCSEDLCTYYLDTSRCSIGSCGVDTSSCIKVLCSADTSRCS
jgi:hypothetical protein